MSNILYNAQLFQITIQIKKLTNNGLAWWWRRRSLWESQVVLEQRGHKGEHMVDLFPRFALLLHKGHMLLPWNGVVETDIYIIKDPLKMIQPLIHHFGRGRSGLVLGLRRHKLSIIMLRRVTNTIDSLGGLLLPRRLWFDVFKGLKIGIVGERYNAALVFVLNN